METAVIVMGAAMPIIAVGFVYVMVVQAMRRRDTIIASQCAAANELRQRAEQEIARARDLALETARLRSEFLDNMSHEIRTPLNGIVGMTRLLLDAGLTAEQREYAEAVRLSGELLRGIVEDVLDFSNLSDGQFVLEENEFDPHDAMKRVAAQFARQAHKRGIKLMLELDARLPHLVAGDSRRLEQILSNLVSNAVKFSNEGEIRIRAGQICESADEVALSFEVSDNGIGIASDQQSAIFQPFSQVDGSTSRNYGGSGLGLAICAELVRQMGGQISVESSLGRGSIFRFTAHLLKPGCQSTDTVSHEGDPASEADHPDDYNSGGRGLPRKPETDADSTQHSRLWSRCGERRPGGAGRDRAQALSDRSDGLSDARHGRLRGDRRDSPARSGLGASNYRHRDDRACAERRAREVPGRRDG